MEVEAVGWTPSKKRMTVPCSAENRKVCARPPKGMKRAKWIALPAKGRLGSFTHDLDELVSKSRGLCEVLMEMRMEEGRISWYPWGVQITVTCLAVARVGPGVGRMLGKTQLRNGEWKRELVQT